MGGLSVFSQTELVEQIPEARVAQALAESQKGEKRVRLLDARPDVCERLHLGRRRPWERLLMWVGSLTLICFGLGIGLVALSWLQLWILAGGLSNRGQSLGERARRPGMEPLTSATAALHPFAARALAEHVKFLDDSLRMYEKSFRKVTPSERDEYNEQGYAKALAAAKSMPVDSGSLRLFDLAGSYYATHAWLTWDACVRLGQKFNEDPRLVLKGSVEVMQRLGVRPCRDQNIGNFCSLYEIFRKDPPQRIEGEGPAPSPWAPPGASDRRPLDHQGTIEWLVFERQFANQKK
jgi:hypothetical protein